MNESNSGNEKWSNQKIMLIEFFLLGAIITLGSIFFQPGLTLFLAFSIPLSIVALFYIFIKKSITQINFLIQILILTALVMASIGNGRFGLAILLFIGLIHVIHSIWKMTNEEKIDSHAMIIAGSGALLFAIITYLGTAPIFFFDGSESCGIYSVGKTLPDEFSIAVDGLNARLVNDKLAWIGVRTKFYPSPINCKDCNIQYPKPDANPNPVEAKIQRTKAIPTYKITDQNSSFNFKFIQQMNQSDYFIPIISDMTLPVRACTCDLNMTSGIATCNKWIIDQLGDYFLGYTWFFNRP